MTLETQTLARACGKSHVHNLEPEDLVALTVEAAAMARVPLAGTSWIPGRDARRSAPTAPPPFLAPLYLFVYARPRVVDPRPSPPCHTC